MKPKAYSYIRWSSDRQTSGDSLKRQLELSEAYAAEHGLELDNRLKDEGVSAYHGLNRTKGDLSIFLEQIKTGEVAPGAYLLVESLDRVSRENVIDAQTLFLQI
ncbi:MAG: recombinase family protein, partial [Phenylobacterium sp.]|uniref:recombinase family protein n=1 Tax=Phenylobacterium sp. TaxID=1871053 RepID=UPI002723B6FA